MNTDNWQSVKLGECVTLLSGGTPSKQKPEYWAGSIPWVSGKDMKVDRIFDSQDHITELGAEQVKKIPSGSLLLVVRGMSLAKELPIAITQREVTFNQDLKALQVSSNVDTNYLYYWFKANEYEVLGIADEAAHGTKRLQTDRLLNLNLCLPPLKKQNEITAVLSAYDDLIENNTRRIAILEEMAQRLYREWFVHFRFPGHEGVALVDVGGKGVGGNGRLPEGWQVVPLKKIAKVNQKSIRKGSAPDNIRYINISSVSPGKIEETEFMSFEDAPSRARRIVKHGDIIWSTVRPNRRSYALIFDPESDTIASTGFAVITANGVPYSYLYHALTTDEFADYLTNRATGSAYPAVNQSDFKNAKILVPPKDLLQQFDDIVLDQIKLKHNLLQKNTNLRQTRDLLLPRLISGQLDLTTCAIQT